MSRVLAPGQVTKESRDAQIRDLFEHLGGREPVMRVAEACLDYGIYGSDDERRLALRAICADVRKALKAPDSVGLPYAGQSSDPPQDDELGRCWVQRPLWSLEDYRFNIGERVAGEIADHVVIVRLTDECFERYGEAPPIPDLVMPR